MDKRLMERDLYRYLVGLHDVLRDRGADALADRVQSASLFASGSTTEFYAEARVVLRAVLDEEQSLFLEPEIVGVRDKLDEIEAAFKAVGGA